MSRLSDLGRLVRAYPTLLRVGLASAIAYRAEFLVWMLSMTMPLVMLALMSAVAREGPLGRFEGNDFTAYYLTTFVVRQLSGAWVLWELVREIREGQLALRLLRPVHPLAAHAAESLASVPLRLVLVSPVAVVLVVVAGRELSHDPVIILAFFASVAGAWVLNFSVAALIGTLALYLESSLAIWELWLGGFMLLSGYLVPLELFPAWVERIARVLPFAYQQAVPVEMLTRAQGRGAALRLLGLQWLYGAVAVTALLLFWRRAVRRFAAFGG
jgi:ABC-2 type transport system permease protein